MKKILLVLGLYLMLFSTGVNAQLMDFGIKGGVNFPSLNSTGNSVDWDGKTGWHGGVMLKLNIPIIQVQAEALYSQTTFEQPSMEDLKNSNLAIPVTAQLSFLKLFSIHTGPQFMFATSQKLGDQDFGDQIDNKSFSWVAGAGLRLGKLDVHARFVFPSNTEIDASNSVDEFKASNWQLSAGFWF